MPDPIPVHEFTGFNFTRRSCFTATPNGAVDTFYPKLAVMKVFSGSEFPSIPMVSEPKPRISIQRSEARKPNFFASFAFFDPTEEVLEGSVQPSKGQLKAFLRQSLVFRKRFPDVFQLPTLGIE
jgi:hypothetical protein